MSITAKELARKLNLSQTAVSMALNNKPGVSTETRRLVVEAAEKYGYDFTKLSLKINACPPRQNYSEEFAPLLSELSYICI